MFSSIEKSSTVEFLWVTCLHVQEQFMDLASDHLHASLSDLQLTRNMSFRTKTCVYRYVIDPTVV